MAKMTNLMICFSVFATVLIVQTVANGQLNDVEAITFATSSLGTGNVNQTPHSPHNFEKLIRIADLLDIFNLAVIGSDWQTIGNELTRNCTKDMEIYFNGLMTRRIWALKMDDATGHYTTGFLFGNNFWTGSMALCKNINTDEHVEQTVNKKTGLSFTSDYIHGLDVIHERPPFETGFYVLKLVLNETQISPNPRTILLGICLPSQCTNEDIAKLTKASQTRLQRSTSEMNLIEIRTPTKGTFEFWSDSTFVILFFVTLTVFILLIWGTACDLMLRKGYNLQKLIAKIQRKDLNLTVDSNSPIAHCTTYDLTDALPNNIKKEVTVGIKIPKNLNNNNSDENLTIQTATPQDEKLSVWTELLLSFSVVTNIKAICDKSVGSDTIPSIHGLRAISMAWVILGHTCIVVFKYADNTDLRKQVEKELWFQTISNGAFSVDTFFFISGFLVSFIYFRTNAKGKLEKLSKGVSEITAGTFHFFGLLAYRFVRLTAPYLFALGVVEVTMKYFVSTSVFEPPTQDHINCPKYWWRNILYINTLFSDKEMCMLWSWYLADDTQFYIIGAIILIIAVRHFKVAASTASIFMVASWVTTAAIAYNNEHMPNIDDPLALFDKIYDKPWTRLGPYLVGMAVGWVLFKTNCKIKFSKLTVLIGWTLSSSCLLYLIYGLYNTKMSIAAGAAYSSLSHTAWAASLAWILIACSTGYGGYVNKILSATWIYPFSRVTYCAYLVHPIVIRVLALNSDAPLHLGKDSMMILFFGQVVASYVLSFAVSIAFEAPVVTMLRILSPNRKKRM